MQEMQVQSLGQENPLEKEMATQSGILAWEIPWTENLVGYSPWGCKELDMTQQLTSSSQQQRRDRNSSSIALLNHYIAFISNIYDILANNHTV